MKNNKTEKPKNDVIYVRVSSDEQIRGFSLDNQEKFCREFSKRDEHSVIMLFREEGESAKTADRTELKRMMLFCDKNKRQISRLVIYKVDRLSRSVRDYQMLRMFFNKLGISIVSTTERFENTPAGKLSENIYSVFAQYDNDLRSQRTIEGMQARLMKGLWASVAPWGYQNTRDATDSKVITPHPDKAPIVKMLFEHYSTNKYTYKELAKMANKAGVKSMHGSRMSKQLVAKIIANPIYYGRIVFPKFGVNVMGTHEPIITEELFNQTQYIRSGGTLGRKLPRNRDNQNFPLRGIKCGFCGKNISGGKTKGKTKYYDYYACPNGECEKRAAIKKVDLETDFTKFLFELTPNNDYFDVLKEAIKLAHNNELKSTTITERRLTGKITDLEDKKGKLLELRVAGNVSQKDFAQLNEKYDFQIAELKKEVSCLSSPELGIDNVVDSGIEFLRRLPENWETLDVKDLRVLRTLLFPENVSYHYPNIKTPEVACIYNLKSPFMSDKTHQVRVLVIEPVSLLTSKVILDTFIKII